MTAESPLHSGIDTAELDATVRPQDDLFRHVNGKWADRTEIPSDKARYGSFYVLAEEAEKAVRDIIVDSQSEEPGTEKRKIGDLYTSFLDEERIEELGATPLVPLLEEAAAPASIPELLSALGRLERKGTTGFLSMYVDNDPGNPERYLVVIGQGGLSLPDESYYREEKFAPIREAYVAYLTKMLGLAGLDNTGGRAARIFALETEIAAAHWDNVRSRDSEATYNLRTWAEVLESTKAVDLNLWLDALDVPAGSLDEVVVSQPSFFEGLAALLTADRLESWTDWLAWQVIRSTRPTSRATSSRRTSTSTDEPSPEHPRCAPAGSAASRSSRVPSVRPSDGSMLSATFLKRRSRAWTCSSTTSSRPTARASRTSTG